MINCTTKKYIENNRPVIKKRCFLLYVNFECIHRPLTMINVLLIGSHLQITLIFTTQQINKSIIIKNTIENRHTSSVNASNKSPIQQLTDQNFILSVRLDKNFVASTKIYSRFWKITEYCEHKHKQKINNCY